ncbi:hypothetical protein ISS30_10485 [bacterium]|nr:hypothetical protein [bacterium]
MRIFFVFFIILTLFQLALGNAAGPPPQRAGEPPLNQTCWAIACHNWYDLNSGSGTLSLFGLPNDGYVPGTAYNLQLVLAQTDLSRWGFELTAVYEISPGLWQTAGSFTITDPTNTQLDESIADFQYVKQTSSGTFAGQTGSANWSFTWNAPASNIGIVYFYYTGNAANNAGSAFRDYIYSVNEALLIQEPFQPQLSPQELNFGSVSVGSVEDLNMFVINNSGSTIIIYDIESSNPDFYTNFTPEDSLLYPEDSLEVIVSFAPSDTLIYQDSLTVFNSQYDAVAYLSGVGVVPLISPTVDSLLFPPLEMGMDTTLSILFQNTGDDTLIFYNIVTSNPVFTIDFPAISAPIPPGGTSDTCFVTFTPEEEILYEDTLFVLCNAYNTVNDTFMVYLRGEGGIVPDTVRNLTIESVYPDAILNWDPVTASIYGSPITIDCYLVYFKQVLGETFNFLSIALDTTFTHENVVQFSPSMFYNVEAYIGEIGLLEDFIAAHGGVFKRGEWERFLSEQIIKE